MIIIMINKNGFGRTERARIAFQCIHSKCRVLYRSLYVSYKHMALLFNNNDHNNNTNIIILTIICEKIYKYKVYKYKVENTLKI